MRPDSPSEYIKKHLDQIAPESVEEAKKNLSWSFGEINLSEAGKAELIHPPYFLDFSYVSPSQEISTWDGQQIPKEEVRELQAMMLAKDKIEQKLDFISLLPPGYKIYFTKGKEEKTWSSYADVENRIIVLNREPITPEALITLLHEIGHGQTWKKGGHHFANEKERLRSGDVTDLAHQLLEERNSWAFAFKKLKPFLDNSSGRAGETILKSDVLIRIKGYALQSYQKHNERSARSRSGMYMSKGEEEWMMGGDDWMSDSDED